MYDARGDVSNMAGRDVIAKLESMEASIIARIELVETNMNAHFDMLEVSTNARFDMLEANMDALSTKIDILILAAMTTLALVTALTAKEFLGGKKKRRSRKAHKKSRSDHRHSDT